MALLSYTVLLLLYCIVLYCTVPYLVMDHYPMKQNPFFPFVLMFTPIKPMYVPLPAPDLSLAPAVTNVRYSVNYKHHHCYL